MILDEEIQNTEPEMLLADLKQEDAIEKFIEEETNKYPYVSNFL